MKWKINLERSMEVVVNIYFINKKDLELVMKEAQYEAFKNEMLLPGRFAQVGESVFINKDEIYLIVVDKQSSTSSKNH